MSETTFELNQNGDIFAINRVRVNVAADLMRRYCTEIPTKVSAIFDGAIIDKDMAGPVGASFMDKITTFTIRVFALPMTVPFSMSEGAMVPNFAAPISEPTIQLRWVVPSELGMSVYLMANVLYDKGSLRYSAGDVFLFARTAPVGKVYRLPTSNSYEDCRLCTGVYDSTGATIMDTLSKVWRQFQTSRWQSDLRDRGGTNGMANSMKMFRYKPNDKEGFTQLPPDTTNWCKLCTDCSLQHITNNFVS